MPPFEEAKEQFIKRTQREIIEEFERIERYSLRDERKQPWGKRTREPFRGTIAGADPSFTDELGLAEQAIGRAGVPFKQRKEQRGRPYTYDRAKLGSALLAKGCRSFEDLSKDLKDIGYRLTLDGSQRWPCSSELHHFFKQLPREWLELALKELEDISKEQAQKFGESLACFGMDGSALQGERLHGLERALEELLERDFFPFTALSRIPTNTLRGIKEHTNKLSPFIDLLPPGSTLVADPEFDVEANYWLGWGRKIDLQIKPKQIGPRKPGRKRAFRSFDKRKYSQRKLGERPFGNLERRIPRSYYPDFPDYKHIFLITDPLSICL
jgi:hypothetical protein